ncbi:MAG: hypothetical protein VX236_02045, partial [Pseudomonadota bacterium]|nr:hypothetical protein [Pseudomonadota bacterium]
MTGRLIAVEDSFQQGFECELTEPEGRRFAPEFKPELTPKKMLELGVFGGLYMTDSRDDFSLEWFQNSKL